MSLLEWDKVIDVQLPWVGEGLPGKGTIPFSARNLTAFAGFVGYRLQRLLDQDFIASVLTVTVFVNPVTVVFAVVFEAGCFCLIHRPNTEQNQQ